MSADAELRAALARAWAPHERRPIYAWAAEHIALTTDYAIPGPFHVARSRYLIEPFDAIADDQVRVVTIQKGVQSGGSLIGDLTALWTMVHRPQNFYWNFPTDQQAKDYAERRARKLIEINPITARLLADVRAATADGRHKIRTTELHLGNMWLAFQGANEGNLQSHSVPMLINEELWQWNPGMYQQALARTTFFEWRKKVLNISQAGAKGCDLDIEYNAGTREEWEVPCPECRQYQILLWSAPLDAPAQSPITDHRSPITRHCGLIWDTNDITRPNGRWDFDALRPTVRYRCAHCLAEWPDTPALRRQLDDLGRYRVTNPHAPRDHRSFHWPSWACPDVSWFTIVREFLQAKDQEIVGNLVPIQEWYRKRPAISYDAALHTHFELVPTIELPARTPDAKPSTPFWPLQKFIFLLVDVQRDHFWGLVDAWSETGLDCILEARKLLTWEDIADLQKSYGVPDQCVFIDPRHRTQEVYQQCVLHGHAAVENGRRVWVSWCAMGGDARREFVWVPRHGPDQGRRIRLPYSWPLQMADPCLGLAADDPIMPTLRGKHCPVLWMAKGTIDQIAFERRSHLLRGETSFVAPGGWNREFSKQLQGEQPETIVSPLGHTSVKSKRVGPNHLLDCYRMGITAACLAKILNPLT